MKSVNLQRLMRTQQSQVFTVLVLAMVVWHWVAYACDRLPLIHITADLKDSVHLIQVNVVEYEVARLVRKASWRDVTSVHRPATFKFKLAFIAEF